ncbi:MAG TPA: rhodanese family protein [Rhizomicrobium sp.]|jgi:rhodanese-related sulfurtransferase|nr:rhodanese family protein [Rhizomicrobium sp.]
MSIPLITPADARRRLASGAAILVDIREPMEHAREAIPGARLQPLSSLDSAKLGGANAPAVIFHCQSGKRTCDNAERLLGSGVGEAYILEGGLSGWKAAGLTTSIDRSKPIEMQRQVQITAGTLVVSGLLLAWLVSPLFLGLSAFVGAGLIFAGVSGWCGMARLLGVMPWNRVPR